MGIKFILKKRMKSSVSAFFSLFYGQNNYSFLKIIAIAIIDFPSTKYLPPKLQSTDDLVREVFFAQIVHVFLGQMDVKGTHKVIQIFFLGDTDDR